MTFLIVDDDKTICNGTARRLSAMQAPEITRIECAYSAEQALQMMMVRHFDVLFADIRMGGMDGLSLVEQAKGMQPGLICVVVTAYDAFSYAQRALRLGVEDFLVKPCSESTMRDLVEKIILRFKARREEALTHLDLRLSGLLLEDAQGSAEACFSGAGITLPEYPLRTVVWRVNAGLRASHPAAPLFMYQPRGHHYFLCACAPKDEGILYAWLEQTCDSFSQCLGMSMPGGTMKEMMRSAKAALHLDWCCTTPRLIVDEPPEHLERSPEVQALLLRVRTLSVAEARSSLQALTGEGDDRPARLDALLRLCWEELKSVCRNAGIECPIAAVLHTGLGFEAAAADFFAGMEAACRAFNEPAQEQPLVFARRYVSEHMMQTIDMAVLANHLNMSYSYFSHWFREKTGLSFSEYVMHTRMQEACRLLLKGERITAVAQRLGYQNTNNFTRTFTKLYGVSPRQWRRAQQVDIPPKADV